MFKLIKKSINIIKNDGIKRFLVIFIRWIFFKIIFFKKKLIEIKSKKDLQFIIKKIKEFKSNNPEEIFNFSWKFNFGFIRPLQIKEEFLELLKIFKEKNPKYIMEIGTANGGTLFSFCKLAKDDAVIISLDLPEGSFGGGYPEWKIPIYQAFKKENQKLYLLREDSHKKETLDKVEQILNGNKLDFLFIDGDHTYEGVKKDFGMYGSLIKNGGIIAFHDIVIHPYYDDVEVYKLFEEIKNKYKENIQNINQKWGGIGIIYFKNE